MKKILLWPNPKLKLVSVGVDVEETNRDPEAIKSLRTLAEEMAGIMGTHGGVGLAAIQIDVPIRVLTTLVDGIPRVFVNPVLVAKDGETELMREGCLSVPDYYDRVRRYPTVTVEHNQLLPDKLIGRETYKAHGLLAQVLQHELEHLDGRLFIDSLSPAKRQNIRGDLLKKRLAGLLRDYR
jgi:peptide deformylase